MRTTTALSGRHRSVVLLMVVAGMLALAGCGTGDSVETASMRSEVRGSESDAASPASPGLEGEPEDSTGSGSTTVPRDGSSPPGDHHENIDEFCRAVAKGPPEPASDDDVTGVLEWMRRIRNVAPTEIVEDMDVLVSMMETLATLDENDPDSFGALFETLMDPAVPAASANFTDAVVQRCNFDPEDLDGLGGDFNVDDFLDDVPGN